MIQQDITGQPIQVANQEVVLVVDKINPKKVSEKSTVISKEDIVVTVNSQEIDSLKKQYPDNDFYGFWSSLLISGIIEPNGLQVYYTSESDGYYIYTKDSEVLETGVLTMNHAPSNYKLNFNTAKSIEFELSEVKLPVLKIKSTADIYRNLQGKKDDLKKGVVRGAFLSTLILAGSMYFMDKMEEMVSFEITENKNMDKSLSAMFENVRRTTLQEKVDQTSDLTKILNLNTVSAGNFLIPSQDLISKKKRQAFISSVVPNPSSEVLPSIKIKSFDDKIGWELEW